MDAHVDADYLVPQINLLLKNSNIPEPTFYPKPMF
jgi:hypothetical protein